MLRSVAKAASCHAKLLDIISPCSVVSCVKERQSYLPQPWGSIEQRRTTVVVERVVRAPLAKHGQKPNLKNKHKLYRWVETEHVKPVPDIQCILTRYVEGFDMAGEETQNYIPITFGRELAEMYYTWTKDFLNVILGYGSQGDVLGVKRRTFRNILYPLGLAIYASPENLAENEQAKKDRGDDKDRVVITPFARMTARKLSGMFLPIPMSGDNEWRLNKRHVKVAFRKMFVELTEVCIELPEEDITEPQDLEIKVTINKAESVSVKARIYLIYKDTSKNVVPEMPPLFESFERKPLGSIS